MRSMLRPLALATTMLMPLAPALATPTLLATGTLTGSAAGAGADLSGQTGLLENGTPGNALGGIGSGLAWAGGSTFIAIPDRGPNAVNYNAAVDNTTSYIARLETVTLALTPGVNGAAGTLTPALAGTTLLWSATPLTYGTGAGLGTEAGGAALRNGAPAINGNGRYYFTGRSDNFGPGTSGNASDARLDPEAVRVARDGRSVFVSDEYGPYVYQFDRATGQRLRTYALPDATHAGNLSVANLAPIGSNEGDKPAAGSPGNTTGRVYNKGMEGLAITPDGKTLVGIMQAPLLQDQAAQPNLLRIVTIDVATGATKEYAYLLTTGSGVSEIVALNDHTFLVDERDGKGLGDGTSAKVKQFFRFDITGATDITDLAANAAVAAPRGTKSAAVVDLVALLGANGVTPANVPSKIEGLAFGDDALVTVGGVPTLEHVLYVANDNDFVPGTSGPNTYYAIGLTDADLGTVFQAQAIPEPGTLAVLGLALTGLLVQRRRRG